MKQGPLEKGKSLIYANWRRWVSFGDPATPISAQYIDTNTVKMTRTTLTLTARSFFFFLSYLRANFVQKAYYIWSSQKHKTPRLQNVYF